MISILATTYVPPGGRKRANAIEVSLRSWKEHIKTSSDIHIHIADDGSAIDRKNFWGRLIEDWASFSYSRQEREGIGASLNRGITLCREKSPFILYPMDDWRLLNDLYLDPWVELLAQHQDVGCIRLAPSGSAKGGKTERFGDRVVVSFERYANYWSMLPALYHERFFATYGAFDEGVSAVEAEAAYNRKVISTNGPTVITAFLSPWQHVYSIDVGDLVPAQPIKGSVLPQAVYHG